MKQFSIRSEVVSDKSPKRAEPLNLPDVKQATLKAGDGNPNGPCKKEKTGFEVSLEVHKLARAFSNCFENENDFEQISLNDLTSWLASQGLNLTKEDLKQFLDVARQLVLQKAILANLADKRQEGSNSLLNLMERGVESEEFEKKRRQGEEEFDSHQHRKSLAEERENYQRFMEKVKTAAHSSPQFLDEKIISELEWLLMTNNLAPEDASAVQQIVSGAKGLKKPKSHE